jgi:hypothetical protein
MSTIKYPGVVQAARNIGTEKKNLAEALYLEIPPRRGRPPKGEPNLEDQLKEAAREILAETGESYEVLTLKEYRQVAAWVAEGNGMASHSITWADASWTAHYEAFRKRMPWAEFVAGKRTKRAVREQAGASTGDVPAAARAINQRPDEAVKLVEGMTPAARRAVRLALLGHDPAAEAVQIIGTAPGPVVRAMTPLQRLGMADALKGRERADRKIVADQIAADELANGVDGREVAALGDQAKAHLHIPQRLLEASYTITVVVGEWPEYRGFLTSGDLAEVRHHMSRVRDNLDILDMNLTDDVVGEVLRHEDRA